MQYSESKTEGSVLLWTVMIITVLSITAGTLLRVVATKYQNATQTGIWQESLLAAESGVDLGIAELRKSLYPLPNDAWSSSRGWDTSGGTNHGLSTITNAGLAGTPMTVETYVDAPAGLSDSYGQYWRVRATGTMPLTGPARPSDNKQDGILRKLSLRWDRFTGDALDNQNGHVPHATRRVEAILRPTSAFDLAILSVGALDLTNQNIVIDSYDSRDPAKSTNGLYDLAKRQENGDIATDGDLIHAGNAHVYGDVMTNSGTVSGAGNVTGNERDDFYQEPIPIGRPDWPGFNFSPRTVTGTATLTASATEGSSASRYRLDQISLSGGSGQTLTIQGAADGSPRFIELYVTGDIKVSGNSQIIVQPGVSVKVYFAGDVDVTGNGIINSNNQPGDLLMYGIQPADSSGSGPSVHLGGNGTIAAAVYAPGHDVTIDGGGSDGHFFGSAVGKTVKMTGVTNLHYDEALSAGGLPVGFKIVSWFEDTR